MCIVKKIVSIAFRQMASSTLVRSSYELISEKVEEVQDRLVVVLYFYLDMPLEEVAVVAGSSVGATRARLYRAINKLRPDLAVQEALR